MVTHSIIQKSQLEGVHRLDPEYFQPEYLELERSIKQRQFSTLEDFGCKVVSGPFGSSLKSEAYLEEGIPFIRISDLGDFFINDDNLIYISKDDNTRLKQSQLQPFDLVLSKVGNTIGIVSAISDELGICNISENNIGIKFKNPNLTLEHKLFLLTFLNSNPGYLQAIRNISGNAQPKLNISDIERLLVPIPQDSLLKLIKRLVTEAKFSIDNSKTLYLQAEKLLLEELGLNDFQVEDDLSFVVNFSDVNGAKRLDADYFQPKYQKLVDRLKSRNIKPLTEMVENIGAKFSPKPEESYKYVDLGNINSSTGIIDGFEEILGKEAPSRAKRLLKVGDVIVSSVEGSLEKVALVGENQTNYLASTGFFQFRGKEILPEVLLILAKSIVMQWQMKKHCAGTVLTAVPNEALLQMLIPILPKKTQEKIAELVGKSHEARKKSKELLEEAKRRVGEMIEKGES